MKQVANIDEYISRYPPEVQRQLQHLRSVIHAAVPEATEAIRYGLATFQLRGKNMVHFGAYEKHIGFYPAPSGIEAFKKELAAYISGKGTLQFPIGESLPFELIRRVVLFRAQEILAAQK